MRQRRREPGFRSKYPSHAPTIAAFAPAPRSPRCLSVAALRDLQAAGAGGLPGGLRRQGGLLPPVAPGVLRLLPLLRAPRRPHLLLEERGRLVRTPLLREPPAALRRLRRGRDRPGGPAAGSFRWETHPSGAGHQVCGCSGELAVPKENGVKQWDINGGLGWLHHICLGARVRL